jgi:hypothetical protein
VTFVRFQAIFEKKNRISHFPDSFISQIRCTQLAFLKMAKIDKHNKINNLTFFADSEEVTQELLEIPRFVESFEKGKKDIAEGRVTPVEQLKRKY